MTKLPERSGTALFGGAFCLCFAVRSAKPRGARKINQRGARNVTGRRHMLGRERPRKVPQGSLPPIAAEKRVEPLRPVATQGRKTMSVVQKEPTIVMWEIRLQQPVRELLDDCARFIGSRPAPRKAGAQ
jgi:hypothetical protein